MGELACRPKQQPIYITVPRPLCEVPNCEGFRLYDMVALSIAHDRVEIFQVCGFHQFVWQGVTPTNFFPLNCAPPMGWMIQQIRAELQRRQAAQRQHTMYQNMYYNMQTGTGTTYIRFN